LVKIDFAAVGKAMGINIRMARYRFNKLKSQLKTDEEAEAWQSERLATKQADLGEASVEEDEPQFIKKEPCHDASHNGDLEKPQPDASHGGESEDLGSIDVKEESGGDATRLVVSDDEQDSKIKEEPQEDQYA
jgi:hypothetical protein